MRSVLTTVLLAAFAAVAEAGTFVHEGQLFGHGDPSGQPDAWFGNAMSIAGDTLVVGAADEETPAGPDAGAAHVFVRSGTTWIEQQKLISSDADSGDHFGDAVGISGDTIVIGAPLADTPAFNAGAAYVFVRSGTVWSLQQKLVPSDPAMFNQFGSAVAISGDTVVVGAYIASTPAGANTGKAYVFVRSGTTWTEQQTLLAPDAGVLDYFGYAVSVAGDTAMVGALNGEGSGESSSGSVYVFVRSGTTWTVQQELTALDGASADMFGRSLALSTETVIVGAPGDDAVDAPEAGSAYVFVLSGGTWTEQQKLMASDPKENDASGASVSVSGDTAMVGAPAPGTREKPTAGYSSVFVRSGTTWTEQQRLTASDGAEADIFGVSVALLDDTAVGSAPGDDNLVGPDTGSAYVFARTGTTWTEQQKLLGEDGSAGGVGDTFGNAVSASGDTAVVGAYQDDTPAGADAGSAYVFARSGRVWGLQQKLMAADAAAGDWFGVSVSVSGDTVIVGAPSAPGESGAGSAYVFVRVGSAWALQQKLLAADGQPADSFGFAVSVAGDTAVVGAPGADSPGLASSGAAYVFVRSGATWSQQAKVVASDPSAIAGFGRAVSVSGDTALIGAFLDDAAGVDAGAGYVFVRTGTVWTQQLKLIASDGAALDQFGASVALDGDTAVLGAAEDDTTAGAAAGSAYVFVRTGTAWTEQQKLLASDGAANDHLGFSVSISGDAAVVGATQDDTPVTNAGAAYVFARSGPTWLEHEKLLAPDGAFSDWFGSAVCVSGDTVVVGAMLDETSLGSLAGSAHVFRGSVPVELQSFSVE